MSMVKETLNGEIILFNKELHTYTLVLESGRCIQAVTSVTSYIENMMGGYKINYRTICQRMIQNKTYHNNPKYRFVPHDSSDEAAMQLILDHWNTKKLVACDYGTAMHFMFENFFRTNVLSYNPLLIKERKEFKKFLRNEGATLKVYGVEIRIFDRVLRLAGSIDALFTDTHSGNFVLMDWKRCIVPLSAVNGIHVNFKDAKLNKYAVQLNVYRNILMACYNINVRDLRLWIYNTDSHSDYMLIEVPHLEWVDRYLEDERKHARIV